MNYSEKFHILFILKYEILEWWVLSASFIKDALALCAEMRWFPVCPLQRLEFAVRRITEAFSSFIQCYSVSMVSMEQTSHWPGFSWAFFSSMWIIHNKGAWFYYYQFHFIIVLQCSICVFTLCSKTHRLERNMRLGHHTEKLHHWYIKS